MEPIATRASAAATALLLFMSSAGVWAKAPSQRKSEARHEAPTLVSPIGEAGKAAIVGECPTLSWSVDRGSESTELVIYRLDEEEGRIAELGETEVVDRRTLPGGAASWTPSREHCLEPDSAYGWAVRTRRAGDWSEWSSPRALRVRDETARLEVVVEKLLERYVDEGVIARGEEAADRAPDRREVPPTRPWLPVRAPEEAAVASAGSFMGSGISVEGDFSYNSTKEVRRFLHASEFATHGGAVLREDDYIYPDSTDDVYAVAAIHFPDGADITYVNCWFYDNDIDRNIENTGIWVYRRSLNTQTLTNLGSREDANPFSGSETTLRNLVVFDVSGQGDPVQNGAGSYFLKVQMDLPSGSTPSPAFRFYGCNVYYEVDEVRPY